MNYSSEFVSDEFLHLNHCGIQQLWEKDYVTRRPKGREDYHILYIFRGRCRTEVLGSVQWAKEGSVILFKPGEKQSYEFFKQDLSISCYIHFTGSACESILNDIGFKEKRILEIGVSQNLLSLFKKMDMEANLRQPFSDKISAACLMEILYFIGRKNRYFTNNLNLKNKSGISEACRYMYENHNKNISVEDCAKQCNLSSGRFSHVFKETTGKTPHEYINEIRISKARELLSTCNYSVSEVAEMVGFSDQNYFARIFKKHTGLSPKKYSEEN